jgi:hypothetical protein
VYVNNSHPLRTERIYLAGNFYYSKTKTAVCLEIFFQYVRHTQKHKAGT